ncbi:hypothetical protein [Halorussus sp. MSC15.2]|uniref:DUF7124 domain-containing protein n=1 Tax=Halorussus sp. MSC15.2 TaxID=2283638 RepID=UPI0013D261DA|nr:hypothetical protein [Halorussus sp. MSC15.2]NEU56992.1 hypothetical protein [Halorussus sp. MSC15.2]
MTDRIDLDELDAGETDEDAPNPGDWFWRGEGDPDDAPDAVTEVRTSATESTSDSASSSDSEADGAEADGADPVPRVPRENDDKPVGVPTASGGAGAGVESSDASEEHGPDPVSASGPHGGGADDMTLAFTYAAATRLSNFGAAALDADGWADWVGIVGRVPAHVLNKFQRDRNVDLDFFNGSSAGPGERLARIGPRSMFYAERMVVVGVEGEDEEIAETADWEFVPLSEAAEKAGWSVAEDRSPDAAE